MSDKDAGGVVEPGLAYRDEITGNRHYCWEESGLVDKRGLPVKADYPSVSSILGMLDKSGALAAAAARLTAEYAYDTVDSWVGDRGWDNSREGTVRKLSGFYRKEWGRRRDRGSVVHKIIEDLYGGGGDLFEVWEGLVRSGWDDVGLDEVQGFVLPLMEFHRRFVGEVLFSEGNCYSVDYGWAGSFDLMCRLRDGRVAVVDFKTGKGLYGVGALQLQAYRECGFVAVPVEGGGRGESRGVLRWRLERLPRADVGVLVNLRGDFTARVVWVGFSEDKLRCLRGLRDLYLWSREEGGGYVNRDGRWAGSRSRWYSGETDVVVTEPGLF